MKMNNQGCYFKKYEILKVSWFHDFNGSPPFQAARGGLEATIS